MSDNDTTWARLIQGLRQYFELRHLTVLIGNGGSIRLGITTKDAEQLSLRIDHGLGSGHA